MCWAGTYFTNTLEVFIFKVHYSVVYSTIFGFVLKFVMENVSPRKLRVI